MVTVEIVNVLRHPADRLQPATRGGVLDGRDTRWASACMSLTVSARPPVGHHGLELAPREAAVATDLD
jgi:hypothetical protein